MTPLIFCCDPGFRSVGYAILRLTAYSEHLHSVGVVSTMKSKTQGTAEDEIRRTRELFTAFTTLLKPPRDVTGGRFVAIAAEEFSMGAGHGGALVARKVGMAWGALVCAAQTQGLPILRVSPSDARKHLGLAAPIIVRGQKRTNTERMQAQKRGKVETQAAIEKRFPTIAGMTFGIAKDKLEHPYDAVSAGIACLADSDMIRMARRHAAER